MSYKRRKSDRWIDRDKTTPPIETRTEDTIVGFLFAAVIIGYTLIVLHW